MGAKIVIGPRPAPFGSQGSRIGSSLTLLKFALISFIEIATNGLSRRGGRRGGASARPPAPRHVPIASPRVAGGGALKEPIFR
ncbi:hypothetical protein EVAR_29668_1 [Eumeta japonica]|uniref:Uncharacterized protein n=1 Tax=Eumeta variegata TaxID=151549 RepID=A0A4C1WAA1_EUMVA|nr:hypothetical protein EVAR_29668_1 [Eumeta japonica]